MQQDDKYISRYHIDDIEKLSPNDSHRIILEFLGEAGSVLDVGCSTGFLGRYLKSPSRKTVGIESEATAAAQASPHYDRVIVGDMTSPQILSQLEDGAFDAIVLGDVIEHLLDPWRAVKDIVNKLADQGILIVSIPHLGHASVIAALLSETFQYQDMGLLDRTHYRFFSLQSLCALLVDTGMTPMELKRVVHPTFGTEIPIATDRLPAELFPVLDRCPESRTYQFVVKAVKRPPTEPFAAYVDKFLLPSTPVAEKDLILQSYLRELETFRREVREARDYIAVCTKTIKEKDENVDHLKKILEREQEEKERLLHSVVASRNSLDENAATRVTERIERRLRDIRELLGQGATSSGSPSRCDSPYDILIPIYNAHDHVKMCVESVLTHTDAIHPVYLLDDASTDLRILPLLQSYAERDRRVRVLTSERNRGFVENVNRGFTLSRNSVVILNSDTEVTAQWLDRMHRCLCSGPLAGIVCPLSNNATIVSVPVMNTPNHLPKKMTPDGFAGLVADCSRRVYPKIPTAVGFCMLIARRVLDQVGSFDPVFGLGYGEENDFCERAKQQGFEILCCDDAYVHHYGEASFMAVEQIDQHRIENQKILNERWPSYRSDILAFCRVNPVREVQERIYHGIHQDKAKQLPSICHVIHNFNALGGTELHTRNIIDCLADRFRHTVMLPVSQPQLWGDMSSDQLAEHLRVAQFVKENTLAKDFFCGFAGDLSSVVIEENFARFLSGGKYDIVHFQHLADWGTLVLPQLAKSMGKKIIISIHDYYLLCPEYNLLLPGMRNRCGKSMANGNDPECLYCLGTKRYIPTRKVLNTLSHYLIERAEAVKRVLSEADAIVAPSTFVKSALTRAYGKTISEKCIVIRHGIEPLPKSLRPKRSRILRVGFLGNASDRKGIVIFLEAAKLLKGKPVHFEIFGGVPHGMEAALRSLKITVHGSYARKSLPRLLSKIDLVAIPSVWDETFCLTAGEAQSMGVPIIASDVGGISERVVEGKTGFLVPAADPEALAQRLLRIAEDGTSLDAVVRNLSEYVEKNISDNANDYDKLYSALLAEGTSQKSIEVVIQNQELNEKKVKTQKPHVSIVILTLNQLTYTKECIESIRRCTPEPHDIIFVDNGSTDGTVQWLRQLIADNPNYRLIENPENMGFSKGCNQGVEAATGEYILLLNNDVVVTENWLGGMIECLNSYPRIGIVGPMTHVISGPQRVPAIGYTEIEGLPNFAKAFRERNRYRRISYRRVVGFCMLFRRQLVEEIGVLDESFGSGNFEDDDYCLRASLAGYQNMIAGDVFIHHYGSRTFSGNGIDYGSSLQRNRNIFSKKWEGVNAVRQYDTRLLILNCIEKAEHLNGHGQAAKAKSLLIEGIQQTPHANLLRIVLAEMLIHNKEFKDAFTFLELMPSCDLEDKKLALLGHCEEGLGRDDKAEAYADRALALESSNVQALNLKGILEYKKGRHIIAERFFKKGIESDPGYGETYTNLGTMRWEAGNFSEGLNLFERGFILSPTNADVAKAYYSAISDSKGFARAEPVFREAAALHPNDKRIAFFLIAILIQQENNFSAIQEIEHSMIKFGIDDGILSAALNIRSKIGPLEIDSERLNKNKLSLCVIVKNEEQHLAKCLMSVKPVVDEMIVIDTGSTDHSRDIARTFGAKVFDYDWNGDFSKARNFSIDQASGDWILVLDADEVISAKDLNDLKALFADASKTPAAYSIQTRNYTFHSNVLGLKANKGEYPEEDGIGWVPSTKVRLFTNDARIRFVNPVHELVEPSLKAMKIPILSSRIPVHHFGKLNETRTQRKTESYFDLGKIKLKKNRRNPSAMKEYAIQCAHLGKHEEALSQWKQFAKLKSESAEAYLNMGTACWNLARYAEAAEFADKALLLNPALKEAKFNRALGLLVMGRAGEAKAILQDILEERPEYSAAQFMLCVACACVGEAQQVEDEITKLQTTALWPYLGESFLDIAKRLFSASQIEYARRALEIAVNLNYANDEIMSLLADCRAAA